VIAARHGKRGIRLFMMSGEILRAGPLAVDPSDQRAWLDGAPLDLTSKPLALLLALMRAPQRLVSKEELIQQVWDGRFVTEAVLTTAMRDLRRALGDEARSPTFIATVHGHGYRFLKSVISTRTEIPGPEVETAKAAKAPRSPLWAAMVSLALIGVLWWSASQGPPSAASLPPSVAVMPFEDLTADQSQTYFADGLSEEIINVLMGVEGVSVASRTSSFAFRDDAAPATEIGQQLNVGYVLEGSVRTDDARMRVQARLVQTSDGHTVWARTFERARSVDDLIAVQEEIASQVVSEMRTELDAPTSRNMMARSGAAGTGNLRAYELYLRSRELFLARADMQRAVRFAREAVEADPNFARGWEQLAVAAFICAGRPTDEARIATARALQLDPNLSTAHALNGTLINYQAPYDWDRAISELELAVELDPTNTTALLWLGINMHKVGYLERAQTLLEDCLRLDAAYDRCRMHLMYTLHMRGQTDRAITEYRYLVQNGAAPDDAVLLMAFLERGDQRSAREVADSISSEQPVPDAVYRALQNPSANQATAQAALREWLRDPEFNPRDAQPIALQLGAYDLVRPTQGSFFALWLPDFPEYRRSPEFQNFVRTMGLDEYWRAHGFPPQCRAVGAEGFACV
jgi:TolB-like protein/DNA-binding winged helix-turn-helix (wHTH) protein/Flp pilus assembly protein TadD